MCEYYTEVKAVTSRSVCTCQENGRSCACEHTHGNQAGCMLRGRCKSTSCRWFLPLTKAHNSGGIVPLGQSYENLHVLMSTCYLTWPTHSAKEGKTRMMEFPKRPSGSVNTDEMNKTDVMWTGGGNGMYHHSFSLAAESIWSVSADRSVFCTSGLLSCAGRGDVCLLTCPGVKDPPCSRANRQLRAAVLTAEAIRPALHTRLGSRQSDKNFSDSSSKCL